MAAASATTSTQRITPAVTSVECAAITPTPTAGQARNRYSPAKYAEDSPPRWFSGTRPTVVATPALRHMPPDAPRTTAAISSAASECKVSASRSTTPARARPAEPASMAWCGLTRRAASWPPAMKRKTIATSLPASR
jgi:hypothetical protein